ncbi:hypothetical protein HK101_009598, partial [Irineochytrium annulatum]
MMRRRYVSALTAFFVGAAFVTPFLIYLGVLDTFLSARFAPPFDEIVVVHDDGRRFQLHLRSDPDEPLVLRIQGLADSNDDANDDNEALQTAMTSELSEFRNWDDPEALRRSSQGVPRFGQHPQSGMTFRLSTFFPSTASQARIMRRDIGGRLVVGREAFRVEGTECHLGLTDEEQEAVARRNAAVAGAVVNGDVDLSFPYMAHGKTLRRDVQEAADKATKYFHEADKSPHEDARYARHLHDREDIRESLTLLLAAWQRLCDDKGVVSWIMHGSLLSWFWNGKLFPWDDDIVRYLLLYRFNCGLCSMTQDVQMPLHHLVRLLPHTLTLTSDRFLLDVNPNILHRHHERHNVIDARFIDTHTGLFIDITALTESIAPDILSCKSPHHYHRSDIFPLHKTTLEGVGMWRPHKVMVALAM